MQTTNTDPGLPFRIEGIQPILSVKNISGQEAKILLKHSPWNVSEIAYALGFTETTHFNNFFKKHVELSPLKFRNI